MTQYQRMPNKKTLLSKAGAVLHELAGDAPLKGRMAKTTPEQRSEIGRRNVLKRWERVKNGEPAPARKKRNRFDLTGLDEKDVKSLLKRMAKAAAEARDSVEAGRKGGIAARGKSGRKAGETLEAARKAIARKPTITTSELAAKIGVSYDYAYKLLKQRARGMRLTDQVVGNDS